MSFELPILTYSYAALEPNIDARTMEIHHSKHHQAYTTNLNNAIAGTELEGQSIEEILKVCKDKPAVRNNGGGFWNHRLFWEIMAPKGSSHPSGDLAAAIDAAFGSFEGFKDEFAKAATTRFGSGWAWLCVSDGKLEICSTAN
ncbi:MAG: superoxide dismutase, partial [Crocinitomicaceae bacterium]|nr:superoxide dismutase [Crocinitomicaceae bacterium]